MAPREIPPRYLKKQQLVAVRTIKEQDQLLGEGWNLPH